MWASDVACGNDVYCVNDVTPDGVVCKHHIIATIGSNIIRAKRITSLLRKQKHHRFTARQYIWYNALYLAGKEVCKKDEKLLVLFELNIKLLYGRYTKGNSFFDKL